MKEFLKSHKEYGKISSSSISGQKMGLISSKQHDQFKTQYEEKEKTISSAHLKKFMQKRQENSDNKLISSNTMINSRQSESQMAAKISSATISERYMKNIRKI
jgi:hypothetical protein